ISGAWVARCRSPVTCADGGGKEQAGGGRVVRELANRMQPPGSAVEQLGAEFIVIGSDRREVLAFEAGAGQRGRLEGNGLRRPGLIAGQGVIHWDFPLFHAIDWFARKTVQDVDVSALGKLPDSGNLLSLLRDVEGDRGRAE